MSDIIVYAEIDDGLINDISLQCLSIARGLGADKIKCIAAGSGISEKAAELFQCGADEVYVADDEKLANYTTRPYKKVVGGWLQQQGVGLALFPSSTLGSDLAASIAADIKASCVIDADKVSPDKAYRIEFDRKVLTGFALNSDLKIVAMRDGCADAATADSGRTGEVQQIDVVLDDLDGMSKVLKRDVAEKTINLKDAKVIVAGGAGVGNKDNLELVKQLAAALGGEVGATRAVVDAGWLPADHQVGQTGATVKPDLYIACGISGAVQHRVGMQDADKIIAINIDENAPIFKIAHYKIVGDLTAVIPKLIQLLKGA